MAPRTVQTLQRLAAETGYRLDTLEKVLRLLELLDEIAQDPVLSQRLALKGGTALNSLLPRSRPTLGGYRLELRRRAGPGGEGARTSGGRCRDRPPVRLAGLRCPAPAHRARGRQVARALRVRTRWQRVAGTRPELHGAPAAVRRSPHGVAYSRPRWDGARSPSRSPRDRGREDRGAVRPGCCARSVRCTAHPRDREGLDRGWFKAAVLALGACNRRDWRGVSKDAIGCDSREFRRNLAICLPRNLFRDAGDVDAWIAQSVELCREGLAFLFELSENERSFLDGVLDRGEVNANLLGVEREVGARIAAMPMLA